jgi:hypothetical protein
MLVTMQGHTRAQLHVSMYCPWTLQVDMAALLAALVIDPPATHTMTGVAGGSST